MGTGPCKIIVFCEILKAVGYIYGQYNIRVANPFGDGIMVKIVELVPYI